MDANSLKLIRMGNKKKTWYCVVQPANSTNLKLRNICEIRKLLRQNKETGQFDVRCNITWLRTHLKTPASERESLRLRQTIKGKSAYVRVMLLQIFDSEEKAKRAIVDRSNNGRGARVKIPKIRHDSPFMLRSATKQKKKRNAIDEERKSAVTKKKQQARIIAESKKYSESMVSQLIEQNMKKSDEMQDTSKGNSTPARMSTVTTDGEKGDPDESSYPMEQYETIVLPAHEMMMDSSTLTEEMSEMHTDIVKDPFEDIASNEMDKKCADTDAMVIIPNDECPSMLDTTEFVSSAIKIHSISDRFIPSANRNVSSNLRNEEDIFRKKNAMDEPITTPIEPMAFTEIHEGQTSSSVAKQYVNDIPPIIVTSSSQHSEVLKSPKKRNATFEDEIAHKEIAKKQTATDSPPTPAGAIPIEPVASTSMAEQYADDIPHEAITESSHHLQIVTTPIKRTTTPRDEKKYTGNDKLNDSYSTSTIENEREVVGTIPSQSSMSPFDKNTADEDSLVLEEATPTMKRFKSKKSPLKQQLKFSDDEESYQRVPKKKTQSCDCSRIMPRIAKMENKLMTEVKRLGARFANIDDSTQENGADNEQLFELPTKPDADEKVTLFDNVRFEFDSVYKAAEARNMKKRLNAFIRGMWTENERKILTLNKTNKNPQYRQITSDELGNLKKACLLLQRHQKLDITGDMNIHLKLKEWITANLKGRYNQTVKRVQSTNRFKEMKNKENKKSTNKRRSKGTSRGSSENTNESDVCRDETGPAVRKTMKDLTQESNVPPATDNTDETAGKNKLGELISLMGGQSMYSGGNETDNEFNDKGYLTWDEIQEKTNLTDCELDKILTTDCCIKINGKCCIVNFKYEYDTLMELLETAERWSRYPDEITLEFFRDSLKDNYRLEIIQYIFDKYTVPSDKLNKHSTEKFYSWDREKIAKLRIYHLLCEKEKWCYNKLLQTCLATPYLDDNISWKELCGNYGTILLDNNGNDDTNRTFTIMRQRNLSELSGLKIMKTNYQRLLEEQKNN